MRYGLFTMGVLPDQQMPINKTSTSYGNAKLVNGSVVIQTPDIKADSVVQLTYNGVSGLLTSVLGTLYYDTVVAGQSFKIKSTSALDSSSVSWAIIP